MGSTTDKIKGVANEAIGATKQTIGKAFDNEKMVAEGALQETKGHAQEAAGKTKDAIRDAVKKS